ncbi:hypothetical protein ciss_22780 [Carboxydothermus islandicus]|uniref:Tyr recombinase domain-containing protein n=1 Tax=Carboxydothermus islandicus TaxID=661089 RepID=A0A1L8D593_9THEO|nr:site-specific integrase [Carboxydothermus islandicus]GAV26345.1 hypothetical protein ciss_22780 [Carboxydothermus islandicus]
MRKEQKGQDPYFEKFLIWALEENLNKRTIEGYWRAWKIWKEFLWERGIDVEKANVVDAQEFYYSLLKKNEISTANYRLVLLGKIYEVIGLKKDLWKKVKAAVVPVQQPKSLSDFERKRLLTICDALKLKDRVIIYLGLLAGLRVSEMAELKWDNIKDKKLQVIGKMGRVREVPLHPLLRDTLNELKRKSKYEYVLPGWKGKPMNPSSIYKRVKAAGELAGIENLHPHQLRHTFAKNLIKSGASLDKVAKLLGHFKSDGSVSLQTVARYTVSTTEELAEYIDLL